MVGTAFAQNPAAALYSQRCAACHGEDASGSDRGPALARSRRLRTRSVTEIHDIIRSLPSLALAHLGTRPLSTSYVVHTDGPRSVEGAFTVEEVQALAERAGLHGATFTRHWPCRFLMAWRPA